MRAPRMMRGGRGGGRGGRGFGGRGGGRGFRRDEGPPSEVVEIGRVIHEVESEMLCRLSHAKGMVPMFNAGIYLENKTKIGKIDEILGPLTQIMFTVKPDPGVQAKTFQDDDIVYIGTEKLLPLARFTDGGSGGRGGGRGGRGGGRGGRGGGRGGRGARFGGRSPGRGRGRGGMRGRGRY